MNRSDEPLFDTRIADWFEDDPHSAPDQALDIVLAAFPSIKQRRRRAPWRYSDVTSPLKLAVAAAAIVVAVAGGAWLLGQQPGAPGVGGQPTPSVEPSVSPSPSAAATTSLLDPSTWTAYTSSRYGFTIARPDEWTETPAERDWNFETDYEAWDHPEATEHFLDPAQSVGVGAWSSPVEPGTTLEAWMESYCTASGGSDCSRVADRAVSEDTKDGHPGLATYSPDSESMAFFLDGETIYVVAVWRGEDDPSVQPYGGARALLEAFVSTLTLPAEAAQDSPAS